MLLALGLLVALLAALGAVGAYVGARAVFAAAAALCGAVAAAALLELIRGGAGEALALPFGPPFAPMQLALDALSAWFALIVGLSGLSASLHGLAGAAPAPRALVAWPLFLAGMLLAVLAGDAFTLLLGFEAMSLASWVLVASHHRASRERRAARLYLGFAAFSGLCLLAAFALVAAPRGDLAFAALRAAPPEGAKAAAFLALLLLGAGAKAGLAPLHPWLPLAHPAAPAFASAAMSGAMVKVAIYVLVRALFDLAGAQQPGWWGLPLIAAGAASALLGALRANLETDTKAALAGSTVEHVGLIALALGLAMLFRGADLGPLAALALAAALLHALAHALFKTLLFLGAGEVMRATGGARAMDDLGGLARGMPLAACCVAVGAASAAALPPLAGFAGEWLLLQALLAGWRVGDLLPQVALAAALAVAAMAAALGAAAMLRLFALVFLGRARTPEAAAAKDARGVALAALAVPAALVALAGLFPAPLGALAEGALRVALGASARAPVEGLSLVAPEAGASYAPLAVAMLLGLPAAAIVLALRRWAPAPAARAAPAWDGGFGGGPDALIRAQPGAAGFGQPLRRMLGASVLAAREPLLRGEPPTLAPSWRDPAFDLVLRPLHALRTAATLRAERLRDLTLRQCLALGFAALVGLLALVAWLERPGA